MLAKLNTFALVGIEAVPVEVEVDVSAGLPKTVLVGLPEMAVRESIHRIERALANLLEALRAAGGGPEHLASLTVYAVDLGDYRAHGQQIGEVWQRLAGREYPAMAAIGVSRLWEPAALVEIQGHAVIG